MQRRRVEDAEQGAGSTDALGRGTPAAQQQRLRMAADTHGCRPRTTSSPQAQEGDRAEPVVVGTEQDRVQRAEHQPRLRRGDGGRSDRVAGERRDDRGIDALPADVTDGDRPVVGPDLEHVVEVAAHLGASAGRPVDRGELEAGDVGERGGISVCWSVRARRTALASDASARSLARRSSRSYSRRSVASKTAVRTTLGAPLASRSSTELTSTGSRRPSRAHDLEGDPRAAPCICSIGA